MLVVLAVVNVSHDARDWKRINGDVSCVAAILFLPVSCFIFIHVRLFTLMFLLFATGSLELHRIRKKCGVLFSTNTKGPGRKF